MKRAQLCPAYYVDYIGGTVQPCEISRLWRQMREMWDRQHPYYSPTHGSLRSFYIHRMHAAHVCILIGDCFRFDTSIIEEARPEGRSRGPVGGCGAWSYLVPAEVRTATTLLLVATLTLAKHCLATFWHLGTGHSCTHGSVLGCPAACASPRQPCLNDAQPLRHISSGCSTMVNCLTCLRAVGSQVAHDAVQLISWQFQCRSTSRVYCAKR
jgi:hypothetical protein